MAALNYNANFADGSSDGSGPYTLVLRRGATAPSDGTVLLTDSADAIRNLHDLFALAYFYAINYTISTVETDPDN